MHHHKIARPKPGDFAYLVYFIVIGLVVQEACIERKPILYLEIAIQI
jgi:hypothetical protein